MDRSCVTAPDTPSSTRRTFCSAKRSASASRSFMRSSDWLMVAAWRAKSPRRPVVRILR
ncbi:hypothetical protein ACIU1J_29440 [Azospirillum doebereinerae]|uniref:hypothetical protein n=1 Tax=Azospirillum doebereinerae TaxID=92933 RepID=UPI0038509051